MHVRIIEESEMDGFIAVMEHAFGFELKPESRDHFIKEFELERLIAAFDGDDVVGTGGAFTFDLTVPGGTVGCGGTTVIAVLPTHRRRGVLTDMMRFHLDEVAGRGEPVAALWASETPIYGRFGYGVASQFLRTKLDKNRISFPRPPLGSGVIRILDVEGAREVLPDLYEKIRPERPGFLTRPERRWEGVHFHDPPEWRDGGTPKRFAVYEEEGEALGWVMYRQHEKWEGGLPANRVDTGPMHALTPAAEEGLWRYLLSLDLVAKVESWNTDPNSVLPGAVADSRRVERTISDGIWVRILDVPAALSARRYQIDGRLVFEVFDPFRGSAAGTFALEGGPEGATCEPVTSEPDLRLDVRELGSTYLGGFSFSELSRAGLVEGTTESLRTADLMFGWPLAPWCPEVF
ncbi:MAG: GNAT family N-acetyltransferase [Acidimicrobiia bacterium]|nr:GNAT family N-acetyltransferase [Acidimicrobiia bacterium]MBT8192098.1 GNAT family N-acetyltransferase [Acidimicrobiia bacterium]NNF87501.1 GNAT family N-acetyltransferase [Acidimicrobiia bacterium]NNL14479.1 GNAT family N-acetyltransferase [Acidimicrobiia bacterium]